MPPPQFPCQKGGTLPARGVHAHPRSCNTATALILFGLWAGAPQHDPPQRPATHPVAQQGGERACDRDLWPGGNTAPETTLLSGYGVDTLRWADNVAAPGAAEVAAAVSFKGADPQGQGSSVGLGDISDAAPRTGLARHA
jgi:hypothetical protein